MLVGPWRLRQMMWWSWPGGLWQSGNAQRPWSRTQAARRWEAVNSWSAWPMSSISPLRPRTTGTSWASQASRRAVSALICAPDGRVSHPSRSRASSISRSMVMITVRGGAVEAGGVVVGEVGIGEVPERVVLTLPVGAVVVLPGFRAGDGERFGELLPDLRCQRA